MKGLVIIGIVILIAVGGFFWYRSTQATTSATPKKSNDTNKEPTSTPTPKAIKKSAYSIEILNGSGIEGEAGRASELLEDAGYTIDSTGNADSYDYEETVIRVKGDVDEKWINQLRSTLEENYTVHSKIENLADDESDSDVVVVVGSLDSSGQSMIEEPPEEETTTTPEPTEEVTEAPTPT